MSKFLLWIPLMLFQVGDLPLESIEVSFYSEKFEIRYHPQILPKTKVSVNGNSITQFYSYLEKSNYAPLLEDLKENKNTFQLNDWLYYQLIKKCVEEIYKDQADHTKSLLSWFLLCKSGYDARITFREKEVFLCTYTNEKIFEVPLIKQEGRTFVNISQIGKKEINQEAVFLLDYIANPNGKSFSFSLQQMPTIKAEIEQKYLRFKYQDSVYNWPVQINRTFIRLMKDYPFVDEIEYIQAPMSELLVNSLLPQIKQSIRGMNAEDAVRFLTVFTRSAFNYMEDKSYFGKSKPMIPDEVFHYPVSDCEDRSALFYALIRSVLDLPMILVAYPDHLTVAVHLPSLKGEAIHYRGKRYLVCDPTGPYNSTSIGKIPKELKGLPYEIIHHYQKL